MKYLGNIFGHIYKITCIKNNKLYIGQTTEQNPQERWNTHLYATFNKIDNSVLHKAIRKYGVENFIFDVLACCTSEESLDLSEILFISQYNSHYKAGYGYNMTFGGKGIDGYIPTKKDKKLQIKNSKLHAEKTKKPIMVTYIDGTHTEYSGVREAYAKENISSCIFYKIIRGHKHPKHPNILKIEYVNAADNTLISKTYTMGQIGNIRENYEIYKIDGKILLIYGLNDFCDENNYNRGALWMLMNNKIKHHKDIIKVIKIKNGPSHRI